MDFVITFYAECKRFKRITQLCKFKIRVKDDQFVESDETLRWLAGLG